MSEAILDNPAMLAERLATLPNGLIVFDGCPGVGKTTLMRDLAGRLQCESIDVDAYLNRKQGMFMDAIRFAELDKRVREALDSSSFVLMATVCAREVIERLGLSKAVFIYVQQNGSSGLPANLDDLDAETGETTLDLECMSELDQEVRRYHANHRPRLNADFLYIRTSD